MRIVLLGAFVLLFQQGFCQDFSKMIFKPASRALMKMNDVELHDSKRVVFKGDNKSTLVKLDSTSSGNYVIEYKEKIGNNEYFIALRVEPSGEATATYKQDERQKMVQFAMWVECTNHTPHHKCKANELEKCTNECVFK